jgi:alpha-tubulin suppressor-like RCC1 family protein
MVAPCTGHLLSGVKAIAAGGALALALLSDGTVVAWGGNSGGQLGNGTFTNSDVPVQVCAVGAAAPCGTNLLTGVSAIAAGSSTSMALLGNGTVATWGFDLGNGVAATSDVPVMVCAVGGTAPCGINILQGVSQISAGASFNLAVVTDITGDGMVRSWGEDYVGELGDGCASSFCYGYVPQVVCAPGATTPTCNGSDELSGVTAVAAGDYVAEVASG